MGQIQGLRTILIYCESHRILKPKHELKITARCDGGFGAAHETIVILGRIVALEAVKLLSGTGKTINNINIEEVIQIAMGLDMSL